MNTNTSDKLDGICDKNKKKAETDCMFHQCNTSFVRAGLSI
jgi:hypothetical protein